MSFSNVLTMLYETILMLFSATFLAYLVGLPIGIILNITSKNGIKHQNKVYFILSTIINILRSIPCLIIVVLTMHTVRMIFQVGTGKWYTMIIPLFVSSVGFVSRMVEQSLNEVDKGKIEAVLSLGASSWQIIYKVLLPEAKPSLIAGATVVIVSILGYTSFAYNIGAGGIISGIWQFYTKNTGDYNTKIIFWILIIIVVIIVQVLQEFGLFISKKIDKRRK